jgi:hypothetical protein
VKVATVEEVERALGMLADRLDTVDLELRRAVLPSPRTVEAQLIDLGVSFHSVLEDGTLGPIVAGPPDDPPDIRLSGTSEDLMALADGELRFRVAYASGRVKVEAPLQDLLRFTAAAPP